MCNCGCSKCKEMEVNREPVTLALKSGGGTKTFPHYVAEGALRKLGNHPNGWKLPDSSDWEFKDMALVKKTKTTSKSK